MASNSDARPRRSVQQPTSYLVDTSDDSNNDSSDEELTLTAPNLNHNPASNSNGRPHRSTQRPSSYNVDSSHDSSDEDPISGPQSTRRSQRLSQSVQQLTLLPNSNLNSQVSSPQSNISHQGYARFGRPMKGNRGPPDEVSGNESAVIVGKRVRISTNKPRKRLRVTTARQTGFQGFKRGKTNHDEIDHVAKFGSIVPTLMKSGRIPPWQNLDYLNLVRILKYASYPFFSDASGETGTVNWLLRISLLSRSFREAAVTTLLFSPPVFPAARAHGLQAILDTDQTKFEFSYDNKIKRLDIEVKHLLMRKNGIDLVKLIAKTPLLETLNLYYNEDQAGAVLWAQPSAERGKGYSYPDSLFAGLDTNNIRLKEWAWNGRHSNTKAIIPKMSVMHQRQCLSGLERLSILNLSVDRKTDNETELSNSLLTGLGLLGGVAELRIESCSLLNALVMESLPFPLRQLSIVNCGEFQSEDLSNYLMKNGSELQQLVLKGNQALDLGFSPILGVWCPHLQVFEMDLTYSDASTFHDVGPHYEAVFPRAEMPMWPLTLQRVRIENLRNLTAADAENFLNSLVAVAPQLRDLRSIYLRILLHDDGWRERAKLRQKWEPKLEDIFLRKAPAPETFFRPSAPDFIPRTMHPRPSSGTSSSVSTDGSVTSLSNRKSTRLAKREAENVESVKEKSRTDASTAASAAQGSNYLDDEHDALPRQRMCSEVVLHIDGQRPAAAQFNETDFLS